MTAGLTPSSVGLVTEFRRFLAAAERRSRRGFGRSGRYEMAVAAL